MSEVTEILEEIDGHFNDGFIGTAVSRAQRVSLLLGKAQTLLSTHVVIDKETADYASRVIEAYTQDQIFTADVAGTISGFKAELKSELSRLQEQKK